MGAGRVSRRQRRVGLQPQAEPRRWTSSLSLSHPRVSGARTSLIHDGVAQRRAVLLRRRHGPEPASALLGRQLRRQGIRSALFLAGCQVAWTSDQLRRRQAHGGFRPQPQPAWRYCLPQGLHPHPLRLHRQPHPGRLRQHRRRLPQGGRRLRRVEAAGPRRHGPARPLLRQRRQPPAGPCRRLQILRILQGAASGSQGCGSRRRFAVLGAAAAAGGQGVGALPLQLQQVQQARVLGTSQGGRQRQEAFAAAGATAERNHHRQKAQEVGYSGHHLQHPARASSLIDSIFQEIHSLLCL